MPSTLEISPETIEQNRLYADMGLTDEEYTSVVDILGRPSELYRNRLVFGHVVGALQLQEL